MISTCLLNFFFVIIYVNNKRTFLLLLDWYEGTGYYLSLAGVGMGGGGWGVRGTGLSLFKIMLQSIFYILPLNYVGEDWSPSVPVPWKPRNASPRIEKSENHAGVRYISTVEYFDNSLWQYRKMYLMHQV